MYRIDSVVLSLALSQFETETLGAATSIARVHRGSRISDSIKLRDALVMSHVRSERHSAWAQRLHKAAPNTLSLTNLFLSPLGVLMFKFAFATALVLLPVIGFSATKPVKNSDSVEVTAPSKPAPVVQSVEQDADEEPLRAWRFSGFLLYNTATQMKASKVTQDSISGSGEFSVEQALGFGAEARWRKPSNIWGFSAGASYDLPRTIRSLALTANGQSDSNNLNDVKVELLSVFANANIYFGQPYVFAGLNVTSAKITGWAANHDETPDIGGQIGAGYEFTRLVSLEVMYRYSAFDLKTKYSDGTTNTDFHRMVIDGVQAQVKFTY